MNEFTYAPVVIPTLNRYEHFKRCLDSLERCSGADKTDVYVGLDYPPSEKYVDGWKKIDKYLANKEMCHGFKNLLVRRRNHNCGVSTPKSNGSLLLQEVMKVSDRYIFSEDDNEFAPNFLEYINWGLETYKDDNSVYAICGFKDIDTHDIANNVYKLNTVFCAWGYGTWFEKRKKTEALHNLDVFRDILHRASIKDAFSKKVTKLSSLTYQLSKKSFHGDMIVSLLPENEKWCIFPKVNMVRNWGQDGTGVHSGSEEALSFYSSLPIDHDKHFTASIVEDVFNPVVLKRFHEKYKKPLLTYIKAAISFITYKLSGYIPVPNKKSKWCKVKLLKVQ